MKYIDYDDFFLKGQQTSYVSPSCKVSGICCPKVSGSMRAQSPLSKALSPNITGENCPINKIYGANMVPILLTTTAKPIPTPEVCNKRIIYCTTVHFCIRILTSNNCGKLFCREEIENGVRTICRKSSNDRHCYTDGRILFRDEGMGAESQAWQDQEDAHTLLSSKHGSLKSENDIAVSRKLDAGCD